jgi:GNAT superfamily N-acetyltransferase
VEPLSVRPIAREQLDGLYPQLAELLEVGGDERTFTIATLDWFFFSNPAGDGVYAGAFENDKLVGVASITPKPFRIDGQNVLGGEIGRVMTHAAFRGRGVFSMLVESLVAAARERGYAFLYATPNQASGRIFIGKLGWSILFHWDRSARPLAWGNHPMLPAPARRAAPLIKPAWNVAFPLRASGTKCTVDDMASPDVADLVDASCAIARSAAYLNWRCIELAGS